MLRVDGTCSTCGHEAQFPFQRQDKQGHIIERCVDHCHDKYIVPVSGVATFVNNFRKSGKTYCKTECPYKPKNKKDYHCKECNYI